MQHSAGALFRALPLVLNHASVANQVMNVNNLIRNCCFGHNTVLHLHAHFSCPGHVKAHCLYVVSLVHPVMFALSVMDTKGALVRLHAVIVSCIARAHIEVLGTTF